MAPRRSVKIAAPEKRVSAVPDKLRGTRRKNTSPLKVPSVITISIPVNKSSLDVTDSKRKVDLNTKIALADEVARSQLLKEPIEVRMDPPAPKTKRGRKKLVVSQFSLNNVKQEPEEDTKSTAATVKKSNKKPPGKIQPANKGLTRKRVADSTVQKPQIKRSRKIIKPANKQVPEENTTVEQNVSETNTSEQQNDSAINTAGNKLPAKGGVKNQKSPRKLLSKQLKLLSNVESAEEKVPSKDAAMSKNSINKKDLNSNPLSSPIVSIPAPNFRKSIPANKHVPEENTTVEQNVSKTKTSEQQNDCEINTTGNKLPAKGGVKNQKSPRKLLSKQLKLLSNVECPEQKVPSKNDAMSKNSINKSDLNSNPFSPPLVSTPAPNLRKRLTRGKQAGDMTLEKKLLPIPCAKSPQNPKAPKPESANNKSGTPQSSGIKSNKTACNEAPRLNALSLRSPKSLGPSVKQTQKKENDNSKGNNTAPVKSRQNSISSISNLSWTRDISTSSTTTCITVSSNDFVCIDKKMPHIKLTNIDSEIDKYKPKPAAIAECADEDSSNSSSSDDSSSSDSETSSEQLSDSRVSPSGCTSVKVNSLNLSSLSRNSVVENPVEDYNNKPKDYGTAAEKLMQALNKIDMEFINWIHDSEFATSDLNRIKDNLFTILNNEFCALKHCRHLQDISNPDRTKNSEVNVTNEPKVAIENNSEKKKLQTQTVESNTKKLSKTEHSQVEPKTVVNNLVNSNEAEGDVVKGNSVESDAVARKLFKTSEITRCSAEDSPSKSDKNKHTVTSSKLKVVTDHITSNRDESYLQKAFIKPSTSGCAVYSKTHSRRVSDFNDSSSESEDFTADVDVNKFIQNAHDDDDALSLFAESITGIESSKINTSIISNPTEKQIEEYVPKPIQNHLVTPPNYSYCPTKIGDQARNGIVKTVCEKQNADSTSIYKESNSLPPEYKESESHAGSVESNQEVTPKPSITEVTSPYNAYRPCLIANLYRLKPKEYNAIFRGYCYYNLIHRCSSTLYGKQCRFSHDIPDEKVVNNKLASLSNEMLLKEYLLIRRNEHIMRRYGMCVLFECERRQLTRVVVEIAYDFITKGVKGLQIDETLKVTAVEMVLLHLNYVDLSVCEDLLKLQVGESVLCEVFMQTMTSTQNFSRFKSVFLSLTYFMVNNDRTFSLEVAEQILERVCILPFDEPVIRALIQIMRLTKPEIFLNSMIEKFENLIRPRRDVFDEYILVKGEVNFDKLARRVTEQHPGSVDQHPDLVDQHPGLVGQHPGLVEQPMLHQSVGQPLLLQPVAPLRIQAVDQPEMREGVPLPPSPDTTHLDNMNKKAEETVTPIITRTILGFRATPNAQKAVISPSSSISEEIMQIPRHENWKHRSIFQQIARNNFSSPRQITPFGRMLRPPGRLIRKRPFQHRLVTLGGSPIAYPPPGQDF